MIESVLQRMQMFSIILGLLEPLAIASTVERPNTVLELQRLVAPIVLAMNLMQIELIMIDCTSQAWEHGLWLDLPYAAKYWYVWLAYLSMGWLNLPYAAKYLYVWLAYLSMRRIEVTLFYC